MTLNVFGPVPSRRLGRSIGINNIPPKVCSYACLYCQVGHTTRRQTTRQTFYAPQQLVDDTKIKISQIENPEAEIDYLTIVSEGEPTLDENLAELVAGLKSLGFPVAVITNASLLWDESVRYALSTADFVSLKVDTVSDSTWKKLNRPVRDLSLEKIKSGIRQFCHEYHGKFVTETMLLKNVNDSEKNVRSIAEFLAGIQPHTAYLAVPTRPPVVSTVQAASSAFLTLAYYIFYSAGLHAEFLIGYEGNAFASTGVAKNDVLSITAVHPMRWDAVDVLLKKDNATWHVVDELIAQHQLKKVEYNDTVFYTRQLDCEQH
jgi:wyosine [tRNA(Phe)-imidazoG37] synthetase (radical SAM superfamily)